MAIKIFIISLITFFSTFAQKDSIPGRNRINENFSLSELREQLDDSFNEPTFANAFWGIVIKSLKTGEIIYKRNADKLFIPASNMKLFTSAAALLLLGSNYVYETEILAYGKIFDGKLHGDLIIQGSGDPTISNRFYSKNITKIFEDWADTLISKGIKEISGSIYGDDTAFDNIWFGKGWALENETSWFSAPSGSLSFNDNSIKVTVKPTNVNYPAEVILSPETKYITPVKKVITVENQDEQSIKISRLRGTNLISVSGKIRENSESVSEYFSITDPTLYFLTVLKEVFEQKGINVKGRISNIENADKIIISENMTPLITHPSVPLNMIISELNKNSNNFYAEQLLKTIGLEVYGLGSAENGVKACLELFNSMGINQFNMVMADGSGLSRLNLVTPRQIVNLLSYMYKTDEFDIYFNSLPIGGVDGTLADRMKKTSAQFNVRAKAGYNNNVSALSGYIKTINGELLAFSFIVNNFLAPSALANYVQDNVCSRLVNFVRN